ncbi:MAG: DNA repair protein RadC [Chitinivibrionales bacterium]
MPDNPNSGHRSRLLQRFEENGISALSDHEIIELVLTYVHDRRETKSIAKDLLKTFKTVSGVVNAPSKQLRAIKGIGPKAAALFPLVKELMSCCLKEKYREQPLIAHRKDVEEHLKFHFGLMREEYVAALYLDNANRVINAEIISEGTVNQCAVYPRTVIERALQCGAASIILAHNHPGGSTNPSEADWEITKRLFDIGKLMEIPLLDHIIIARETAFSLRELSRWPAA